MEGDEEMEQFLEMFGGISVTITQLVGLGVIIFSAYGAGKKAMEYFSEKKKTIIEKAQAEHDKDEEWQKIANQVAQYPKWHQQSIDIQRQFTTAINELRAGQEEQNARLEKMEADGQKREINKLRDRILQSYRYYTSSEKNPQKAWSAMEADAFWRMFGDYEDLGGDGYVHSDVQPAMNSLAVVQMDDTERLCELMRSRK